MVSRENVIAAYRLILGREPESDAAVQFHMEAPDVEHLRITFTNSAEFQATIKNPPFPFPAFIHNAEPIRVDVKTDDETLRRILCRVERCWTQLGETRPHWSVASADRFKPEHFEQHADEFYASGKEDESRLITWLNRNDLNWSRFESCLELGCGVGRVTQWLARRFQRVIACDVSAPHLELAAAQTRKQNLQNIEFVRTSKLDILDGLPDVDIIFSILVLQHNPPPIIYATLARLLRRLKPGGVAFFQVPTYGLGYRFEVRNYLASPEGQDFDMHMLPQRFIFELAAAAGCSILEVEPDLCTGIPTWISNTFLVCSDRH